MFDERHEQPVRTREEWKGRLRPTFPNWGVDELCFAMSLVQRQEQNRGAARPIRQVLQQIGLFNQDLVKAREQLDVLTVNYLMDENGWNKVLTPRRILG